MFKRNMILSVLFFLSALFLAFKLLASEIVTDDTIQTIFGRSQKARDSHSVMSRQRDRLHDLLDGYLSGDPAAINKASDAIAKDMQRVAINFPSDEEQDTVVWTAMSEIVNQAHALHDEARKGNYAKSYQHYSLMTTECIKCHQVLRRWGKFPEPAASASAVDAPKTEAKVSPAPKKTGKLVV